MLKITLATVAGLLALCSLGTSAQATDSKIYNGAECRQTGWRDSHTNEYIYNSGPIYNGSRSSRNFVCPIVRDQTKKHLKSAWVKVYTSGTRTVSCKVISQFSSPWSGSANSTKVSTASGARTIYLGGIGSSSFVTHGNGYSISCSLPYTGSISLYGANENS